MIKIASNEYYRIEIDTTKNRVFLTITGFWQLSNVSNYIDHWRETVKFVKPGYTILLDTRQAITHPKEVMEMRQEAMRIAINAGLLKSAELTSKNIIAQFQLDTMSKNTAYPKQKFDNIEQAEQWLNELSS